MAEVRADLARAAWHPLHVAASQRLRRPMQADGVATNPPHSHQERSATISAMRHVATTGGQAGPEDVRTGWPSAAPGASRSTRRTHV